jgi:hypothetical protein
MGDGDIDDAAPCWGITAKGAKQMKNSMHMAASARLVLSRRMSIPLVRDERLVMPSWAPCPPWGGQVPGRSF